MEGTNHSNNRAMQVSLTISNWQSGVTELPLSKLLMLAEMWNCTTDYLLGLDSCDSA